MDEGVRGVIVHGHTLAHSPGVPCLRNGKGEEDSKAEGKKRKTDQQLEKQRGSQQAPQGCSPRDFIFLTMQGGTRGLSWMENPGVWFRRFLKKLTPGHKGSQDSSTEQQRPPEQSWGALWAEYFSFLLCPRGPQTESKSPERPELQGGGRDLQWAARGQGQQASHSLDTESTQVIPQPSPCPST